MLVRLNVPRCLMTGLRVVLAACLRRVSLAEHDVQITDTPVVMHFSSPYEATGPTRELCLTAATTADVHVLAPHGDATREIPVTAVLIRSSGQADTLGVLRGGPGAKAEWRSPIILMLSDHTVCLWDHGLSNPENEKRVQFVSDSAGSLAAVLPPRHPRPPLTAIYTGVELRSRVPVHVRTVSLWTGRRFALF